MNNALPPIVTIEDERPAGKGSGKCFYCIGKIGDRHDLDCVIWTKTVIIRLFIEYPIQVPHHWDRQDIEFHRNEGGWCGDNAIDELRSLPEETICRNSKFEYVTEITEGADK